MIGIICAMTEERDALLKLMEGVRTKKAEKLLYKGKVLNNEYYLGNIEGREVVLCRCGVGKVYATMVTAKLIEKFKPELIINLGCAGSLNENVHVGDVVLADRVADWEFDVPGWERSVSSTDISYACDERVLNAFRKLRASKKAHLGPIVSADTFIYKKAQVRTIRKYFPEALCGEMEGSAVAGTCYAHGVNFAVIRSISDETLVNGSYKEFDFNLEKACDNAAKLAVRIINNY